MVSLTKKVGAARPVSHGGSGGRPTLQFIIYYLTNQPINQSTKLDFLAAIGAIIKPPVNRAAAIFTQQTGFLLVGGVIPLEFIFGAMAAFTDDERLAFFDPDHRNEKYLKIMIDALVIGLLQAANRTTPGLLVQNLRFWRYAND
jgi:hypothetical protein